MKKNVKYRRFLYALRGKCENFELHVISPVRLYLQAARASCPQWRSMSMRHYYRVE